jgi:hypothetical protein
MSHASTSKNRPRSTPRAYLVGLAWLLTSSLLHPACAASDARAAQGQAPIETLEVVVRTLDDWGAGTTDGVTLSLGPAYEWVLDQGGREAFEHGHVTRFRLSPHGLHAADIHELAVRKTRGGDDWCLDGIELWVNGKPYYRSNEMALWLTDAKPSWTATDIDKKREQ